LTTGICLVLWAYRSSWVVGTRGWSSPTPLCNLASHHLLSHLIWGLSSQSLEMHLLVNACSNLVTWNTISSNLIAATLIPITQMIFLQLFVYWTFNYCSETDNLSLFKSKTLSTSDCLTRIDKRVRESDRRICAFLAAHFDLKYCYEYRYRSFFRQKLSRLPLMIIMWYWRLITHQNQFPCLFLHWIVNTLSFCSSSQVMLFHMCLVHQIFLVRRCQWYTEDLILSYCFIFATNSSIHQKRSASSCPNHLFLVHFATPYPLSFLDPFRPFRDLHLLTAVNSFEKLSL